MVSVPTTHLEDGTATTAQKKTKVEQAIAAVRDAAENRRFEFFHDNQRRAWASVPVNGHMETYAIRSRDFRLQVMRILYEKIGEAPKQLIAACIEHCETVAICTGPMSDVFV
jgi:hypothetical protein